MLPMSMNSCLVSMEWAVATVAIYQVYVRWAKLSLATIALWQRAIRQENPCVELCVCFTSDPRSTYCKYWAGSRTGPPDQPGAAAAGSPYLPAPHRAASQSHMPMMTAAERNTHLWKHTYTYTPSQKDTPTCLHTAHTITRHGIINYWTLRRI